MKKDDSFKKPGAVPFKWEIRPGVPKVQDPQTQPDNHFFDFEFQKVQLKKKEVQHKKQPSLFPKTPPKLKPPPARLYFQPQSEPRTRSFGSSPSSRSHRFGLPGCTQPDVVDSVGCFPSPLPKRKYEKGRRDTSSGSEPDYYSDLDFSSRWSVSSRKSFSSFASCQSSPRLVSEAEWAALGLF